MAQITPAEFTSAITALTEHYGVGRLRDKLANMGAFSNRKGLGTAEAIAERLHRLTGGLRLRVPATYAFTLLWGEMLSEKLGGKEAEEEVEGLADKVNACLGDGERIVEGKEADLDAALAAYREGIGKSVGPEVARLDMLLKAVPAVAERLRAAEA